MRFRRMVTALSIAVLSGAGLAVPGQAGDDVTITLLTHDSFNVSKSVLRAFTQDTGVRVKVLRGGDAGQVVNQAILTKDNPLADVLYGVDNTFLSRALDRGIFERYRSPELDNVASSYVLDPKHRVTPIDRADVCINYDTQWFAEHDLAVPSSYLELTLPEYRGLLVVENPATSSPGLAFMLATRASYPSTRSWHAWLADLEANDVAVVDGWEQAWFERFTAVSEGGDRPLVVSYASSPPATIPEDGGAARAAVLADSCFEQIELAGVLKGTEHRRAARQLVDFMLSEQFQEDMPEQMYVFPVREGAELPAAFEQYAALPEAPALSIAPDEIQRNRERWIRQWTDIVLR